MRPLSGRELDVLRLLCEGLPNKAIAARLGIAAGTVKTHVRRVTLKMGATNRSHVVAIAANSGLFRVPIRLPDTPQELRTLRTSIDVKLHHLTGGAFG
jgi:DNA-binding CsgD family transcriptional regulator